MPDDQTEKMIRLLEEIRDLAQQRNEKLDAMLQAQAKRYEDALQRQDQARARDLAVGRRKTKRRKGAGVVFCYKQATFYGV
jgi:hypothetical protein